MRKTALCVFCAALATAMASTAHATLTTLYSTDFNASSGYTTGNLVGQNGWVQVGTSTATPVQEDATNGDAVLGTSGQDVANTLSPTATQAGGGSVFLYADITITGAQTGDYFLHLGDGTTTNFFDKIFAKTTTGGFLFGAAVNSSTGTYATPVESLNTVYHVVADYNIIPGAANDTVELFINPATDPALGLAAPDLYVNNQGFDMATFASVNMRQGTAASAPNAIIDNLKVVASDVVVPEPTSLVLGSLGLLSLIGLSRRKFA